MIRLIAILLFFISVDCFGQTDKQLGDSAFKLFMKEQYDSAIPCYQKLTSIAPADKLPYLNHQLGNCYFEIKKYKEAEEYFLLSLGKIDTVPHFYSTSRQCCLKLADIYMQQGSYAKALHFLQVAERLYPFRSTCGTGRFEINLLLSYKFAECYEKLGSTDSAIICLTPFMFVDTTDLMIEPAQYMTISDKYIRLLRKFYPTSNLRVTLQSAVDDVYYKKISAKERGDKMLYGETYYVNCWFNFMGSKVVLENGGYEAVSWGGEPVLYFTKQYLIEKLSHTPTYQNIMRSALASTSSGAVF